MKGELFPLPLNRKCLWLLFLWYFVSSKARAKVFISTLFTRWPTLLANSPISLKPPSWAGHMEVLWLTVLFKSHFPVILETGLPAPAVYCSKSHPVEVPDLGMLAQAILPMLYQNSWLQEHGRGVVLQTSHRLHNTTITIPDSLQKLLNNYWYRYQLNNNSN